MATKGKKIDTYRHDQYGIEVDIRLDTKTGVFYASVYEQTLHDKDLPALKTALKDLIEANAMLAWIPIIIVRYNPPTGNHHRENTKVDARLKIERLYVAQRHDKSWSQVGFDITAERFSTFSPSEYSTEELRLKNARRSSYTAENLPQHKTNRNGSFAHQSDDFQSIFAYTEELWTALSHMIQAYHILNQRVADMLQMPGIETLLAQTVQAMLPSITGGQDDSTATEET